jgi:hypothetical protein
MGQLNKIFNNETVDLVHVSQGFKPLSVILKPMDELVFEVLWKLEEVKSRKVRLIMTN